MSDNKAETWKLWYFGIITQLWICRNLSATISIQKYNAFCWHFVEDKKHQNIVLKQVRLYRILCKSLRLFPSSNLFASLLRVKWYSNIWVYQYVIRAQFISTWLCQNELNYFFINVITLDSGSWPISSEGYSFQLITLIIILLITWFLSWYFWPQ